MKRQFALMGLVAALLAGAAWLVSAHDDRTGAGPTVPELIVSSARDAGPDTLRDAILAADRLPSRVRILIRVPRIVLTVALPALINPYGIDLEAAGGDGTIQADGQDSGAVLQINGANSVVRGVHILHAREAGVVVNASDTLLDGLVVQDSKLGILWQAGARRGVLRTAQLLNDETGVLLAPEARDVSIISSVFHGNTRAGVWFIGPQGASAAAVKTVSTGADTQTGDLPRLQVIGSVFDTDQVGVVLANAPTLIRQSRFLNSVDSAVLVLNGTIRLEESEVRRSGGTAVSINPGSRAVLRSNLFTDNAATAVLARDSEVLVEHNTLVRNGFGIVAISSDALVAATINDNVITASSADAITLIGGAPLLQRNRLIGNHGAGVRVLDLIDQGARDRIDPHLTANVMQGNGLNDPVHGDYHLGAPP